MWAGTIRRVSGLFSTSGILDMVCSAVAESSEDDSQRVGDALARQRVSRAANRGAARLTRYPRDEVWLTDGYGDYVRHFLRAMAVRPDLAPDEANHILYSTSVVTQADYYPDFNKTLVPDVPYDEIEQTLICYETYDTKSIETLRMAAKPSAVIEGYGNKLELLPDLQFDGWTWEELGTGGILKIKHSSGDRIRTLK